MVQILDINTDNPWWRYDLGKSIDKFQQVYGIQPKLIIGKNVMKAMMEQITWVSDKPLSNLQSDDRLAFYEGIPCEYDPDISCVILKA